MENTKTKTKPQQAKIITRSLRGPGNKYGCRQIRVNGIPHTVHIGNLQASDEVTKVHFVLISQIDPKRYETNNRGWCKSNNLIQLNSPTGDFYIEEEVTDHNTNFTQFRLVDGPTESTADTQIGSGFYAADKYTIDDKGYITKVED